MAKREYIQANKDWLEAKAKEDGVKALPKGIYYKVLRADIDYNRHMNNANYVRVAMELLSEDFTVRGLRVEYRVAAKLGDVLIPTLYQVEGGIILSLSIGDNVSAIVEFTE
ncbi:thioesterase family protein [Prevotella sp. E13-27]|uniref:thioesterase family protein n=1 Tax=Prevotella sp. E13-27 TaxID=2938122 RepID=UPI00200A5776|nr:thioesterase family protein [Prevotella sp. E13-27]MCK8623266.1 thioesterase [Prevotella sp. E13-27]